jgi:N-carbamoyl-L-amino-acid hydrolase
MEMANVRSAGAAKMKIPKIDGTRVLRDLYELRKIGEYKTGVHRPSLSNEHVVSLRWLVERLKAIGAEPVVDGIGNVLGYSKPTAVKLLAGSHLESQNYAGWLDGALGVVYALEAARVINGSDLFDRAAVEVGAWCDEEGHFGHFLGSRSFCGDVTEPEIDAAVNRTDGRKMRDALAKAGLAHIKRESLQPGRYFGYLEAHIEQGDWLESNNLKAGIVTTIVGIWQFKVNFEGLQNHAGTTRMAIRKDAGLAAAKLCVAIDDQFPKAAGPQTVWTTGRLTLDPGAPSIIPGEAELLFQIRDADPHILARMESLLYELVANAHRVGPCHVQVENLRKSQPAKMHERIQAALETAAGRTAPGKHTRMPSGAGHDAQIFAGQMPAGMLFVPSIGGISHHWTENTSDEDIVLGAQIFADAAADLLRQELAASL